MNAKTELATIEDRKNVVAIQLNHDVIKYEHSESDVKALIKKHDEFKKLDVDDKPSYDLAVKAISEVRTWRVTLDKQRKSYKKPVTEFGKEVDIRAKKLIEPLQAFEDELKLEKQRIDDIKAERKAAIREAELRQRQEQLDRLNMIRDMYIHIMGMSIDELNGALLDLADFGAKMQQDDYGESYDDAVSALGDVRVRLNSAIAQAEQAADLKRQQEQAQADTKAREDKEAAEKAEREKVAEKEAKERYWKDKEAEDKLANLERLLAEQTAETEKLKEENKPKPEPVSDIADDQFIDKAEIIAPADSVDIVNPENQGMHVSPDTVPAVVDFGSDITDVTDWIWCIKNVINSAPKVENEQLKASVIRVAESMDKACGFLESTIMNVQSTAINVQAD